MNKQENSKLMRYADEVLREDKCPLFKKNDPTSIHSSYNGQIAALGVSILMIGLKPTISVYYQDTEGEAYRQRLLGVIAKMLEKYKKWTYKPTVEDLKEKDPYKTYANALTRDILGEEDDKLKTDILNCSIALKQVIRTYKLD